MLRRHAELVGLKSNFTILDTDDQIRLLKQIIEAENIDEKRWPARAARRLIDGWKNRGLDPGRCAEGEALAFADGKGVDALRGLSGAAEDAERRRFRRSAAGHVCASSASMPTCWRTISTRFRYMLVDEYQDTNVAQYLWLRLLGAGRDGAPQSLRGRRRRPVDLWLARRGGRQHPALRAGFSRRQGDPARAQLSLDRPHPRRRLASDRAQRSPPRQDAAHRRRAGREARGRRRWDSEEEARIVGEEIEQLQRKGAGADSIAILVRASFQMREFEERFITLGFPIG